MQGHDVQERSEITRHRTRRVSILLRDAAICAAMMLSSVPLSGEGAHARPVAAKRSNIPPFCVLTGGPRGPGSLPAICRFYDYQQCLQAAAQLRGNCVINVDYPDEITSAPGAAWSRPAR